MGPETDWGTFAGHPLLRACAVRPRPASELRWRSLSQGGPGEWMTAPLTVLTAPPETPQPARSPLGVWAYRTVQPSVTETEQATQAMLRGEVCAQLQRLGVSRLVLSDADDIASARAYGLLVSLASPWSFDRRSTRVRPRPGTSADPR